MEFFLKGRYSKAIELDRTLHHSQREPKLRKVKLLGGLLRNNGFLPLIFEGLCSVYLYSLLEILLFSSSFSSSFSSFVKFKAFANRLT